MTRVAIQGIQGSYSEEAVREIFGETALVMIECADFDATFEAVRSGEADNAVVPIENKIVGPIQKTTQLLSSGEYRVLEKLPLKVRHVLAVPPGTQFGRLESVLSHIEALRQCAKFFVANPGLAQIAGTDTASSVRRIVEEKTSNTGAICSRRAAAIYDAEILRESIADDIDNWTIFYLIGK